MRQKKLISKIQSALSDSSTVRGLFLAGSFGRGTADRFSDIDLVAVADIENHELIAGRWRENLESIVNVVFWNQWKPDNILLNAVTEDWQRIDLYLTTPEAFRSRTQDSVKPLIDPDNLFAALPRKSAPGKPDKDRITFAIQEFIRILGLLYVVAGREEYYTSVSGAGMLRDHLVTIMIEEEAADHRGGALHLSRVLSRKNMDTLKALPFPRPDRAEVINALLETARVFFPRARKLASVLEIEWPAAFELATLRVLKEQFGAEFDVGWD